jgi:hypothetical protein
MKHGAILSGLPHALARGARFCAARRNASGRVVIGRSGQLDLSARRHDMTATSAQATPNAISQMTGAPVGCPQDRPTSRFKDQPSEPVLINRMAAAVNPIAR